jgi:hypothetical protein
MMWMPSIRLRVAWSHSAKTSTPFVGSASMALLSAGRFLMSLPDTLSRKIWLQFSARKAAIWRSRFWSTELTRAWPIFIGCAPKSRDDFLSAANIGITGLLHKSHKVRFLRHAT